MTNILTILPIAGQLTFPPNTYEFGIGPSATGVVSAWQAGNAFAGLAEGGYFWAVRRIDTKAVIRDGLTFLYTGNTGRPNGKRYEAVNSYSNAIALAIGVDPIEIRVLADPDPTRIGTYLYETQSISQDKLERVVTEW